MRTSYRLKYAGIALVLFPFLWTNLFASTSLATPLITNSVDESTGKISGSHQTYPWASSRYTFLAHGKTVAVQDILRAFAQDFSVTIDLDPSIDGAFNGQSLDASSPAAFLNHLAAAYGFSWYYFNGKLSVYSNGDKITKIYSIPSSVVKELKIALDNMGVAGESLYWGQVPGQDVVIVMGPKKLVSLIDDLVPKLNTSPLEIRLEVIRLKHADVYDRNLPYRDQNIVIPGVATILKNIVQSSKTGGSGADVKESASDSKTVRVEKKINQDITQKISAVSKGAATNMVSVEADNRLNAVIIRAPAALLPVYEKLVHELDTATSLVEIDASILDIDQERAKEIGVAWTAKTNHLSFGFGDDAGKQDAKNGAFTWSSLPLGASGSLSSSVGNAFLSRVHMLETQGAAKIVSQPSILTMDNTRALFDLSKTFYVLNSGVQTTQTTPVSAGLTLSVTPRIVEENQESFVQLWLDIEDGDLDLSSTVQGYPTVDKNNISTVAMVNNNQSLLIAGNQVKQTNHTDQGFPILSKIPILGWFFGNKGDNVRYKQRFFLITPRIITIDEMSASAPDGGKGRMFDMAQHLPKDLQAVNFQGALAAANSADERLARTNANKSDLVLPGEKKKQKPRMQAPDLANPVVISKSPIIPLSAEGNYQRISKNGPIVIGPGLGVLRDTVLHQQDRELNTLFLETAEEPAQNDAAPIGEPLAPSLPEEMAPSYTRMPLASIAKNDMDGAQDNSSVTTQNESLARNDEGAVVPNDAATPPQPRQENLEPIIPMMPLTTQDAVPPPTTIINVAPENKPQEVPAQPPLPQEPPQEEVPGPSQNDETLRDSQMLAEPPQESPLPPQEQEEEKSTQPVDDLATPSYVVPQTQIATTKQVLLAPAPDTKTTTEAQTPQPTPLFDTSPHTGSQASVQTNKTTPPEDITSKQEEAEQYNDGAKGQ